MALSHSHTSLSTNLVTEILPKDAGTTRIFAHRKAIRAILNRDTTNKYKDNDGKTNYPLLVADYLESISMIPWMSLEMYNLFVMLAQSYTGKNTNYSQILKRLRETDFRPVYTSVSTGRSHPESINHLIHNQASHIEQGIVELISNGIDAMNPGKSIGRFGEGFYQSLRFLTTSTDQIHIDTYTGPDTAIAGAKNSPISLHLRRQNDIYQMTSRPSVRTTRGTTISLVKTLKQDDIVGISDYVSRAFATNNKAQIYINGTQINTREGYIYHNGEYHDAPNVSIYISISPTGISVADSGTGMSPEDISSKLLAPKTSGKKKSSFSDIMTEYEAVKNETAMFYKKSDIPVAKTHVRLTIAGVLIEDFHITEVPTLLDFTFDFPSFTWVPDSRNRIEITREVTTSLVVMLGKMSRITDHTEL